ncbi:MAG: carboxymuconolactone decarboxylase family protein [Chloroflexi bacterium]|nr:carboxymuconolactone decarboxylase family protein [Chloroflexota bacterium]
MTDGELRDKYGAEVFEAGQRVQPTTFEQRLAQRDALDQHFTQLWLDFAIEGFGRRKVLDDRTRLLVMIGQFTMVRNARSLEDSIRGAIAAKVPAREVLEIVLQCAVYGGNNVVDPALEVFERLAKELGLTDELRASQLPRDGHDSTRSLEDEMKLWHADDLNDPRREELLAKHDWRGISTGLKMRPQHHLNVLEYLDTLDSEFAGLWLDFCYRGMYSRWQIDDKTRLLCMVGDCVAMGDAHQARAHMRGAMRQGATAREVLEVVLQSCLHFGMPPMLHALATFVQIMTEDGRLDEIGNPARAVM